MSEAATRTGSPGLKGEVTTVEPDRFERQIARRSAESRATVPSADVTQVLDAGALSQAAEGLDSGLAAHIVAATAAALRSHPRLNGAYRDAAYELYSRINIGLTLAIDDTPTTPTLFDADLKTVAELAQEITELTTRAREAELNPAELAGATFTVLDASAHDIFASSAVVLPTQAAALSFGPVRAAPVVRDGQLVAGQALTLILSADQRIVHGHQAASFLGELKMRLEEVRP